MKTGAKVSLVLVTASLAAMTIVTSCNRSGAASGAAAASLKEYLNSPGYGQYGQGDDGRRSLQKTLLLKTDATAGFAFLADQDPPLAMLGTAELSLVSGDKGKEWLVTRLVIYGVREKALSVQTVSGNRTPTPPMSTDLSMQQKTEWDALMKKHGLTISDMEKAKSAIPIGR